ncbi:MAG: hypothetical protein HN348_12305 [Proteobacteria bacterium]|nr:hypothetical protein [Pseudomonadota bacterium]
MGVSETFEIGFFDEPVDGERPAGPPLPEKLVEICLRAMSRNPDKRYRNGTEMAGEIEAWLDGSDGWKTGWGLSTWPRNT